MSLLIPTQLPGCYRESQSQLAHLQQCDGFASADARAALLRDTSRLSSRAARLFAQYVAQVAYETEC